MLTPKDIETVEFTIVRLREGYHMEEVDDFLDRVQESFSAIFNENEALRSQGGGDGTGAVDDNTGTLKAATAGAASGFQLAPGESPAQGGMRLLQQAERIHDDMLAQARTEAAEIVATARVESDRMTSESKTAAEHLNAETTVRQRQLDNEIKARTESMDAELAARREELLTGLEGERVALEGRVEELRGFEREYRGRLKSYLSDQLAALDTTGVDLPKADGA